MFVLRKSLSKKYTEFELSSVLAKSWEGKKIFLLSYFFIQIKVELIVKSIFSVTVIIINPYFKVNLINIMTICNFDTNVS
jgi:hypothetical protein